MKIARSTKDKIASIKQDADMAQNTLQKCVIRLNEHAGTKRIASKLERVIDQLDRWQKSA